MISLPRPLRTSRLFASRRAALVLSALIVLSSRPSSAQPDDVAAGITSSAPTTTERDVGHSVLMLPPLSLSADIRVSAYHTEGLQSAPGIRSETDIFEVAPTLRAALGNQWVFNYSPTWRRFSSDRFEDTLDHAVALKGATTYRAWTFGVGQTYTHTSYPLAETGRQTEFDNIGTSLRADLDINENLIWRSNAGFTARFTPELADYRNFQIGQAVLYRIFYGLNVGAGVHGGYVSVDPGVDQTYQRPQLQIAWQMSPKLALIAEAGVEARQFRSGGAEDVVNPIFGAELDYALLPTTHLTFAGTRDVGVSFFRNQVIERVVWLATIDQRLLGWLHLELRASESSLDYVQAGGETFITREDRRRMFSAQLSTTFRERSTLSFTYHRQLQSSTIAGFNASGTWYGLDWTFAF